ncbi:MAG: NAD-dependent epimerase/dehydratase family protein [Chloroflexota bacterium]
MPQTIFITGGNGFIGSRVVGQLISHGYRVRCLLRSTSDATRIDDLPIERVTGDIRNRTSLEAGMQGCDGVIHLASLSNWDDIHSPLMHEVVVAGSCNVLAAAQACGNLRTVYVSSIIAVNGTKEAEVQNEESPFTLRNQKSYSYAFAKREAEEVCREMVKTGLPVVIVNPTEVYGPHDYDMVTAGNLVDFAQSNPVFVPTGGTSIVHVDDVAAGIIAAFEQGRVGERYILGGDNLTIRELAALVIEILGEQKPIVVLPNALLLALAKLSSTVRLPLPFNPAVIPYAVRYWWINNSKAREELGVTFRSLQEVLEPTIEWLADDGQVDMPYQNNREKCT